jgi:hypothetical protein
LQQVHLAKSLPEKLGGSNACIRPPGLSNNHQCSHAYYESPQAEAFCAALAIRPASIKFGRYSNVIP